MVLPVTGQRTDQEQFGVRIVSATRNQEARDLAAAETPPLPQTTLQAMRHAACNAVSTVASAFAYLGTAIQTRMHPSAPAVSVITEDHQGVELLPPALAAQHAKATIAELPSPLAAAAAGQLQRSGTADPAEAGEIDPVIGEAPMPNHDARAQAPAGNFLTRFFTACTARLFTGSAQVQPAPVAETLPTIEELLNGQHAANLKTKGFMLGSFGYGFFKTFSVLANADTKTLIGRISTLETGAAEVQKAADKVAKALTNKFAVPDLIIVEQETLLTQPFIAPITREVNAELKASLAELHKLAEAFVGKYKPTVVVDTKYTTAVLDENSFVSHPIAYTAAYETVLMNLIKNSPTGKDVTLEQLKTLLNRNLLTDTIISKEVDTFIADFKKALIAKGGVLPSAEKLSAKLVEKLAIEGDDKEFIEKLILKKLGSFDIQQEISEILKPGAQSPELTDIESERTAINATIDGFAKEIAKLIGEQEKTRLAYLTAFKNYVFESSTGTDHESKLSASELDDLQTFADKKWVKEDCEQLFGKYEGATSFTEVLNVLLKKTARAVLPEDSADQASKRAKDASVLKTAAFAAYQAAAAKLQAKCNEVLGSTPKIEDIKALFRIEGDKVVGFKGDVTSDAPPKFTGFDQAVREFKGGTLEKEFTNIDLIPTKERKAQEAFSAKQATAARLLIKINNFKQVLQQVQENVKMHFPSIFAGLPLDPRQIEPRIQGFAAYDPASDVVRGASAPNLGDILAEAHGEEPVHDFDSREAFEAHQVAAAPAPAAAPAAAAAVRKSSNQEIALMQEHLRRELEETRLYVQSFDV